MSIKPKLYRLSFTENLYYILNKPDFNTSDFLRLVSDCIILLLRRYITTVSILLYSNIKSHSHIALSQGI